MTSRFAQAILLAVALAVVPTLAVSAQDNPPAAKRRPPEAPGKMPKVGADRTKGLDFLFGALKAAPDEDSAKAIGAIQFSRTCIASSNLGFREQSPARRVLSA